MASGARRRLLRLRLTRVGRKIDVAPFPGDDLFANLRCRFSLSVFLIGEYRFHPARRAERRMIVAIAIEQARVVDGFAIAPAIARQLIENFLFFRRDGVNVARQRIGEHFGIQCLRQRPFRWFFVVCRDALRETRRQRMLRDLGV